MPARRKSGPIRRTPRALPCTGWREWAALPAFGVRWIKVKVDTGARSSALHAFDLREFERDGARWVRFEIHPYQRSDERRVVCEAPLVDERRVRTSAGHEERRPVIRTTVRLGDDEWPVEITLTNRDAMGFRMLLGRAAVRHRYLVDAGRSYLAGPRPPASVRRRHRRPRRPPRKDIP